MEINNLVRRLVRIVSKGLIVVLIGSSVTLYKPAMAEAPSEHEGWNPQNIQTLLSHPLANENFELSEQLYNKYILYTETISAGLTYKDFRKLRNVALCESSYRHDGIYGDKKRAYGFFQIWEGTFDFFLSRAEAQGMNIDGFHYKDIESQVRITIWAYENKLMSNWSCWK